MLETILCVDDDPITLMLCKMVITKAMFSNEIATAKNGEEALIYFDTFKKSNSNNWIWNWCRSDRRIRLLSLYRMCIWNLRHHLQTCKRYIVRKFNGRINFQYICKIRKKVIQLLFFLPLLTKWLNQKVNTK